VKKEVDMQGTGSQAGVRKALVASMLCAAISAALALSACGGSSDGDADRGGGSETSASTGTTITFINPLKGHPFTRSMECGAQEEADKLGLELEVRGASQYSVGNVTQVINAVAATNPKAVFMAVWDLTAFNNSIASLVSGGAKFVAVDGVPTNRSVLTSSVTSNNLEGGKLAGQAMLDKLRAGDTVLVMQEAPANTIQGMRAQGFIDAVKAAGVTVLPVQYSQKSTSKVTSIVSSTLAKNPDLNGVYVTNGDDAAAVHTALAQAGKTDRVTVVAYDAGPTQIDQLKRGEIYATVAQRPDIEAATAVRYLAASLAGRSVPAETQTKVNIVTRDNLNDPEIQDALYRVDC
jgi:ribose transport system substrate-binding protein